VKFVVRSVPVRGSPCADPDVLKNGGSSPGPFVAGLGVNMNYRYKVVKNQKYIFFIKADERTQKNPHKAGWGRVQKSPRGAGLLHLREIALRNFLLKDF